MMLDSTQLLSEIEAEVSSQEDSIAKINVISVKIESFLGFFNSILLFIGVKYILSNGYYYYNVNSVLRNLTIQANLEVRDLQFVILNII